MKKNILTHLAALLFVASVGGSTLALATPQVAMAADTCTDRLLTFPAWYRGLQQAPPDCGIKAPGASEAGLQKFIWTIVLNVIEMLLQLVGYLAVAFIIIGGYKYMTSAGSSDGMVKARKTIFNAIIGLVLSIASVAIVNVIAGAIK